MLSPTHIIRQYTNIWPKLPQQEQAWRNHILPQQAQGIVIEIGAGVGLHPIQYSLANANSFLVAIERTKEKYQKFAHRFESHPQCTNLYPIHADATKWISQNIQPEEVTEYFILYPNPYPKEGQKNKRFHYMPFMYYLIATLRQGGLITIATNEEFYYQEAKSVLVASFGLQIYSDVILNPLTHKPRTHFEKKYLLRGERCFNLVLQKV